MTLRLDVEKGTIKQDVAELVPKMEEATVEALKEIAVEFVDIAKSLCPVDTGSLQKSIRMEVHGNVVKVRAGGYVTNPKTGRLVDYATHVEGSQPFMRPAWASLRQRALKAIRQQVEAKVNE